MLFQPSQRPADRGIRRPWWPVPSLRANRCSGSLPTPHWRPSFKRLGAGTLAPKTEQACRHRLPRFPRKNTTNEKLCAPTAKLSSTCPILFEVTSAHLSLRLADESAHANTIHSAVRRHLPDDELANLASALARFIRIEHKTAHGQRARSRRFLE